MLSRHADRAKRREDTGVSGRPRPAIVDRIHEDARRTAIGRRSLRLPTAMSMLAVCVLSTRSKYTRDPWVSTTATATFQLFFRHSAMMPAAMFFAPAPSLMARWL